MTAAINEPTTTQSPDHPIARHLLRGAVVNIFLFLAYAFVWIIFMVYAWSLSRRQRRLQKELEELKARNSST